MTEAPRRRRWIRRWDHNPRRFADLRVPPSDRLAPTLHKLRERVRWLFADVRRLPGELQERRSEVREACKLMLESACVHLDLLTLRIGFPSEEMADGWRGLDRERIAQETGLPIWTIDRAIVVLQEDLGYVRRDGQPRERFQDTDGNTKFRGHGARRSIVWDLFDMLGMAHDIEHARRSIAKSRREDAQRSHDDRRRSERESARRIRRALKAQQRHARSAAGVARPAWTPAQGAERARLMLEARTVPGQENFSAEQCEAWAHARLGIPPPRRC